MSTIKVDNILNSTGDQDSGLDLSTNDQIILKTANTTAITVNSSQNTTFSGEIITSTSGTSNVRIGENAGDAIASGGNNNTLVGDEAGTAVTTGTRNTFTGFESGKTITTTFGNTFYGYRSGLNSTAQLGTFIGDNAGQNATGNNNTLIGQQAGYLITSGGSNTIIGRYDGNQDSLDIRTLTNNVVLSNGSGNVRFYSDESSFTSVGITGQNSFLVQSTRIASSTMGGGTVDNAMANGWSNRRWTVVYAVSGSINTSDENEKQDIEALNDKEKKVAVACKGLIKKYRWKDAVAKKGDDARIHVGIIAQELKSAFEAEGLDASKYGMFCSDTWWEKDETKDGVTITKDYDTEEEAPKGATKKTRLGIRYEELLAFIISAI